MINIVRNQYLRKLLTKLVDATLAKKLIEREVRNELAVVIADSDISSEDLQLAHYLLGLVDIDFQQLISCAGLSSETTEVTDNAGYGRKLLCREFNPFSLCKSVPIVWLKNILDVRQGRMLIVPESYLLSEGDSICALPIIFAATMISIALLFCERFPGYVMSVDRRVLSFLGFELLEHAKYCINSSLSEVKQREIILKLLLNNVPLLSLMRRQYSYYSSLAYVKELVICICGAGVLSREYIASKLNECIGFERQCWQLLQVAARGSASEITHTFIEHHMSETLFNYLQMEPDRFLQIFIENMHEHVGYQRNGHQYAYDLTMNDLQLLPSDDKRTVIQELLSGSDHDAVHERNIVPLCLLLQGCIPNADDWNLVCAEQHWCFVEFFMLLREMCDLVCCDNDFSDKNNDRKTLVDLWNTLFLPLIEFHGNLDSSLVDLCDPDINEIFTGNLAKIISGCAPSILLMLAYFDKNQPGLFAQKNELSAFVNRCNGFVTQWLSSKSVPQIVAYSLYFMQSAEVRQIVEECCDGIARQLNVALPVLSKLVVDNSDSLPPSKCSC